jgi:hypothetical protein
MTPLERLNEIQNAASQQRQDAHREKLIGMEAARIRAFFEDGAQAKAVIDAPKISNWECQTTKKRFEVAIHEAAVATLRLVEIEAQGKRKAHTRQAEILEAQIEAAISLPPEPTTEETQP